mgnify:CR=1 FL=1|tara:strand:+ start:162 stop:479 length:318 start_codon:yes stop_codon:yes gene_type:complete
MTFQFGTIPDPDKDGIMEVHHYRQAVEDYDKDGALMDSPMLKHWFVINVCDVLLGEDAMYSRSPRDLYDRLVEFSNDAQKWTDMVEEHDVKEYNADMEYQRQCSY